MYEEDVGKSGYTFYVLMSPVGDSDLQAFLHDAMPWITQQKEPERTTCINYLKTWPLCLASALEYFHSNGIQHEDIKPTNIINRSGLVLFADFGASREIRCGDTTSTSEPAAATRLFAAPEALDIMTSTGEFNHHGSQSDVF